jgi:hypothetical protein
MGLSKIQASSWVCLALLVLPGWTCTPVEVTTVSDGATGGVSTASGCVPAGEICNGIDDDCDGLVDEGLGATTCGTGACERTTPVAGL